MQVLCANRVVVVLINIFCPSGANLLAGVAAGWFGRSEGATEFLLQQIMELKDEETKLKCTYFSYEQLVARKEFCQRRWTTKDTRTPSNFVWETSYGN